MRSDAGLALVALATALCVAASVGACLTGRRLYERAHFLSPVTILAAPLLGVGLALQDGANFTSGEILLICLILAATGPVMTTVTARLVAQNEGRVRARDEDA